MSNYEELKKQLREQKQEAEEKRLKNLSNKKEESSKDSSPINNYSDENKTDNYNMDEKWQRAKRLVDKIEPRLYKFIFKETRDASIDARNYLNELRKLCIELRAGILSQRQDNESKY